MLKLEKLVIYCLSFFFSLFLYSNKFSSLGITPAQDEIDHTVIKYNCDYVLRGAAGRYLTSVRDKDPLYV